MRNVHRLVRPLIASGLVLAGLIVGAAPASATHIGCGAVITENTTLDGDVGPCAADGLVVMADGITLDLAGYRVFGATPNVNGDNAGIRLFGVSGVTVTDCALLVDGCPDGRHGTVEGFDAGVAVMGGSGNTVSRLTVQNNIADFLGGNVGPCSLGDGIALFASSGNTIDGNKVIHNGPYGGISVVNDSDNNVITRNQVSDQDVVNPGGCFDQPRQDEGIRIEGPGADGNRVDSNTIVKSDLAGIGMHSVVCVDQPNTGNTLIRNTISQTQNLSGSSFSGGIAFLETGDPANICPAFGTTVKHNTSSQNVGSGIFVSYKTQNNVFDRNITNKNGVAGLMLDGPAFSNVFTNVGPSLLDLVNPDQPPYVEGLQFRVLSGSGSGDVTAPLVPVGNILIAPAGTVPFDTATSGCSASDFVGFPVGAVALIQRGFCGRATKVDNAVAAGASAVVMFNEGSAGRTGVLTAGVSPTTVPVVGVSYATGVQLYNLTQAGPVTIHVVTNTTNVQIQIAPGAHDNLLTKNSGRDNVKVDGFDGNTAPPCDNNKWDRNAFLTVNQSCVQAGAGVVRTPRPAQANPNALETGRNNRDDI